MKALVTGAAGFIGSCLTEELIRKGFDVTCLVRPTSNLKWIEHSGASRIFCDLIDVKSCQERLRGFDYVFHLAGLTKAVSEKDFFTANVDCTRNLLQAVLHNQERGEYKIKRFIYLSSLAAAGPSLDGTPVREDSAPQPVSAYGRSKLGAERVVWEFRGSLPVTIIRPPAVYGPRDTDFLVMFRIINKGLFPHWGRCYYSMLYVEDLVNGILLAAVRDKAEGELFHLSDNNVYTNEDIAHEIMSALGKKALEIRLPVSLMPVVAFIGEKISKKGIINSDKAKELRYPNWTCDSGKALREFGFRPKTTLREGMKWTAEWYRIHRWL